MTVTGFIFIDNFNKQKVIDYLLKADMEALFLVYDNYVLLDVGEATAAVANTAYKFPDNLKLATREMKRVLSGLDVDEAKLFIVDGDNWNQLI